VKLQALATLSQWYDTHGVAQTSCLRHGLRHVFRPHTHVLRPHRAISQGLIVRGMLCLQVSVCYHGGLIVDAMFQGLRV